jgi:hypothetical protein
MTDAAEFARQTRRAKAMFLDVLAGVAWTEMTMLHRQEHSPDNQDDEEDEFYDPFYGIGPREIPLYIYKVLDSGIPRQPTLNRFRAGLTMFGIPAPMIELYDTFVKDYKGPDFNLLWHKLNRTMVTSDTGNYCSFHSLENAPLQELDEDYVNGLNSFLRRRSNATDSEAQGGLSEDEAELEPVPVKPVGAIGGALAMRREKLVGQINLTGDALKGEEYRKAIRAATAQNIEDIRKINEKMEADGVVVPPLKRSDTGMFTIGQQPGEGGEASGFLLGAKGQVLVGGKREIKKEEVEVMEGEEDSGGDTDILVQEADKPAVVLDGDKTFPVPQEAIDAMNSTTLAQVVAAALSR